MSRWEHISHVYFAGIGGIGMSALAQYFVLQDKSVSGYDKTPSEVTRLLESQGISITFQDAVESIPEEVRLAKEQTLLVYTPALPSDHRQMEWFRSRNFSVKKRSEVLAEIVEPMAVIAVAGTHGKTTTSAMATSILLQSEVPFCAFLGGISADIGSNFYFRGPSPELAVVEADEYDRSFLRLHPQVAIITSLDQDHLDVYGDSQHHLEAYQQFVEQVKLGGKLVLQEDLELEAPEAVSFGYKEETDYRAVEIQEQLPYTFNVLEQGRPLLQQVKLPIPGRHNVLNALAAIAATRQYVQPETTQQALQQFRGIRRRFEFVIRSKNFAFVDDYAHHPKELCSTIQTLRELYPGKTLTGIFQPHLFSRTRDFAEGFAHSLGLLDEVILLPIYPAREQPIEGVSSEMLLDLVPTEKKKVVPYNELVDYLRGKDLEILTTLGAGDIDRLVQPIATMLNERVTA